MLNVLWDDRLETLADTLFDSAAGGGDPFVPECLVVGRPVMKWWLKQHFLFEGRRNQRVLANWDFVPLHQFVNDWLARMDKTDGPRQPALHPYSKECLRWRIYRLLENNKANELATLHRYVGVDEKAQARRRFGLAGQIARMFDDYQNYRAEMLVAWEKGKTDGLGDDSRTHADWQRFLWLTLKSQDADSYLAQFLKMDDHLPKDELQKAYRQISVFHVSSMPVPYIHFFALLSEVADVNIYAFNPSKADWFGDVTPMQGARKGLCGASALVGLEEDVTRLLETGNPLLSSWGKGCQSYLDELLDRTDGQPAGEGEGEVESGTSLLARVQAQIRGREKPPSSPITHGAEDPSIQFHICHSPMREVEVLRDQLLGWFKDNPDRQPRHVQVLVADLDAYAPFIDAVFQTELANARDTIPYEIADRPKPGAGPLGTAYLALLRCGDSRFTASELMGLLSLDGIREAFGLSVEQFDAARELVIESGIRWGADANHLKSELNTEMDAVATWRRGLDRLLLGYAMGRDGDTREPRMVAAGDLGSLRTIDGVEGDGAHLTGTLCRFFDEVYATASAFKIPCSPAQWEERLQQLLDTFFHSTNATFAEITEIQSAIRLVAQTAAVAGNGLLPHDVIASAIEEQLHAAVPAATATSNKVLFSPMRTMRPTPRPLLCLLGMDEGVFPRRDDRPTFDLMTCVRRRGDRSLRLDDRLAFLESLMCARERLVISYVGRSQKSNESMPPSTVVSELQQYLDDVFHAENRDGKPTKTYLVREHRLQAFHPTYFTAGSGLVSFSKPDFEAAVAMRTRFSKPADLAAGDAKPADFIDVVSPACERLTVRLTDLHAFFANPAKTFYTKTLQAKIDNSEDGMLSDKEAFSPNGLEKYQINDAIWTESLAGKIGDDTTAILREQGLLPLGETGNMLVEDRQAEIKKFLGCVCFEPAVTVRDLITASLGNKPPAMALVFDGADMNVTGNVRIVTVAGKSFQVFARYASIKPKDRLKAWIAHLLGCAANTTPFETILMGKGKAHASIEVVPAVSPDIAKLTLEVLLTLWQEGTQCVLPFAPAASYEYVKACCNATTEDDRDDEGLEKAGNAWHNDFSYSEDQDVYLYHVWGSDGPMVDPKFGKLARDVWDPFFNACSIAQENVKSGGGEGGEE